MAHDHKIKTHVPTPPTDVNDADDMQKMLHMNGQITHGHYRRLPTTQVKDGHKTGTTFWVEPTDHSATAVPSPV